MTLDKAVTKNDGGIAVASAVSRFANPTSIFCLSIEVLDPFNTYLSILQFYCGVSESFFTCRV